MKYKRLILILSAIIISVIYIIHPYVIKNNNAFKYMNEDIIRFHIRANSDETQDQELKLKIRDEILNEMAAKFQGIKSIDNSREIILNNMDEMKSITERVIAKENKDYSVNISLGIDEFPIRKYGNIVLPQGEYETLLITLGEGRGQNWWCVMFPPLCFVDITHSIAYTEEEIESLIDEEGRIPLKLKSIVLEKLRQLFK